VNGKLVIAAVGGLLVGTLLGYSIGVDRGIEYASGLGGGAPVQAAPVMPPGMPQGLPPQQAGPSPAEYAARIDMNERIVAKDPKNRAAWVALGNDYFDTHQAQKSVEAYQKALDLGPDDPNVLTDQGVMYRELRQYDRAIANFEKASQVDPAHVQSLFNLGVVWENDLKDRAKAAAAMRKVIAVAPGSPQAAEARAGLARLGEK